MAGEAVTKGVTADKFINPGYFRSLLDRFI
jgi:hypothetical protein